MSVKEETVKIKKIVLDLGDKEIVLSMEQARKLKDVLAEMFGKDIIKEVHHHHDYWWEFKKYPITYYSETEIKPLYTLPYTTCKASFNASQETLCLNI